MYLKILKLLFIQSYNKITKSLIFVYSFYSNIIKFNAYLSFFDIYYIGFILEQSLIVYKYYIYIFGDHIFLKKEYIYFIIRNARLMQK